MRKFVAAGLALTGAISIAVAPVASADAQHSGGQSACNSNCQGNGNGNPGNNNPGQNNTNRPGTEGNSAQN